MEPAEAKMMLVAYLTPYKWCVVDAKTWMILSKDHIEHEDAVRSAETISYRINKGWAP